MFGIGKADLASYSRTQPEYSALTSYQLHVNVAILASFKTETLINWLYKIYFLEK